MVLLAQRVINTASRWRSWAAGSTGLCQGFSCLLATASGIYIWFAASQDFNSALLDLCGYPE